MIFRTNIRIAYTGSLSRRFRIQYKPLNIIKPIPIQSVKFSVEIFDPYAKRLVSCTNHRDSDISEEAYPLEQYKPTNYHM